MGRPSKNNVSTSPDLVQVDVGENEKNNAVVDPIVDNTKEDKTAKKIEFDSEKEYEIISKERAGKKIIANKPGIIEFDDKGKTTVKGDVAKYLIESGLGFKLA